MRPLSRRTIDAFRPRQNRSPEFRGVISDPRSPVPDSVRSGAGRAPGTDVNERKSRSTDLAEGAGARQFNEIAMTGTGIKNRPRFSGCIIHSTILCEKLRYRGEWGEVLIDVAKFHFDTFEWRALLFMMKMT